MSFIYRDGNIVPLMKLNQGYRLHNRFKKFFGTTTVKNNLNQDVEVYNKTRDFYRNGYIQDEVTKRFVKALGIEWESFISNSVDSEVERMYFKLKDDYVWDGTYANTNVTASPSIGKIAPSREMIANAINTIPLGTEIKVRVKYGGELARYIKEHELEWYSDGVTIISSELNSERIREVMHSNPVYYFMNSRHALYIKDTIPYFAYNGSNIEIPTKPLPSVRNSPIVDVSCSESMYGIYSLIDNGDVFELKVDDSGKAIIEDEVTATSTVHQDEVVSYSYTLTYTFNGCSQTSYLVNTLNDWCLARDSYESKRLSKSFDIDTYKEDMVTATIDTKFKRIIADMYYREYFTVDDYYEDSLYINGYMKVDAVDKMKKRDFVKLITKNIDTDYTVESKEWWEDLLMVVLIIATLVIAFFTAGLSSGVSAAAIATFAGTAAIGFTIAGLILAELGGLSSMSNVKVLGNFATITGYIAMITGIYAAIQSIARNAARTALEQSAKEGAGKITEQAITDKLAEMSVSEIISNVFSNAVSSITNAFTSSSIESVNSFLSAMSDVVKVATKGYEFFSDQEKNKLDSEYEAIRKEEEEYNETILNRHLSKGGAVYELAHLRLSTPDMLQELDEEMKTLKMGTPSYTSWYTTVNS